MLVRNIHERRIPTSAEQVGSLIDTLASTDDKLWPKHAWPAMKFQDGLRVGANGGHGPVRYFIEAYDPGKKICFRFTAPRGFDGFHGFEIVSDGGQNVTLRHVLKMNVNGLAMLSWPFLFRPLHNALIEDALYKAERNLGIHPAKQKWSWWVKTLRWLFRKIRTR